MAIPDARQVRRVRCPRCNSLLEEPSAPVYQCGGCGTSLRAKIRAAAADTQVVAALASPSRSGLPPQGCRHSGSGDVAATASSSRSGTPTPPDARSSRQHQTTDTTNRHEAGDHVLAREHSRSGDVASTSSSTTDATNGRRQGTGTTSSRRESGNNVQSRNRVPDEHVPAVLERKELEQSTSRGVSDNSEDRRRRDASGAECSAGSRGVGEGFGAGGSRDAIATESHDSASITRGRDRGEPASASAPARAAESRHARDDSAAAWGKAPNTPPRNEFEAENLAPLRKRILKTVDDLRGDLSELFSKSPELNPTAPRACPRPRRRPEQEGDVSRATKVSGLSARSRNAVNHRGGADREVKPGHAAAAAAPLRGLPSRRYRRCRADPCRENVQQPRPCHHGCCSCSRHGKPECSSCRGRCRRPLREQEPSAPRKPSVAAKPRPPPRHHCRPILKGAPFIVCSTCFTLVQVPAGFAVSTNRLRKLQCGSCSAVLSYSYRDPGRKKTPQESIDQLSTDGEGYPQPDPFAFIDGFGLSSYSTTEDEQALHVSRNTSFDTVVDGAHAVGRLHRLMGYGSASELLRRSPDLYESFRDERATPDSGHYDRKGKGVCVDCDDDVDDSDDEDVGARKRSAARSSGWPLPGMLGKGVPGSGAIRIRS